MSLLSSALEYAARGWAVFPLKPGSKIPLTGNGFKAATTDPHQIEDWWKAWPEANIGIATGAGSGLVVLDFDKKHGGLETYQELVPLLPCSYEVETAGGGYHVYLAHPGVPVPNRAGLLQGMDVRGDGGYVVAPPSVGETGKYFVIADVPLAPMNEYARGLVVPRPRDPVVTPARALESGQKGDLAKSTLRFILEGAAPGTWHHTLVKASLDLKQQGYELDEALTKLESGGLVMDDSHDLPTIEDIFLNREVKHPPRFSIDDIPITQLVNPERAIPHTTSLVVKAGDLSTALINYLGDKDLVKGEPTGIESLDKLLGGGKRLGEVTAWHAEAKTGKNTIWHKLMHNWLGRNLALGYASRELTPETEVLPDLLSIEFQENARTEEIDRRASRYKEYLGRLPLYFAQGYGYFPADDIRRWMDELQGLGVQYFWFDHLHYMLEDPEEHKEASKLIKEIKTLAKERNVHIDIIIQPNKLMDGQRLSLNSIKGGAAMGQAIDNLIIVEHTGEKHVRRVELKAARSKLAETGHFYLKFNPQTMDFCEVEVEEQEAPAEPPSPGNRFLMDRRLS
jgi:hypothetical protein